MELTSTRRTWLDEVRRLWATGLTQYQVADAMGLKLSSVRGRLRYYGYKFGRMGVLVAVDPIDAKTPQARA